MVVAAFNQEKALEGAFSVIVQLRRLIVCSTIQPEHQPRCGGATLHYVVSWRGLTLASHIAGSWETRTMMGLGGL